MGTLFHILPSRTAAAMLVAGLSAGFACAADPSVPPPAPTAETGAPTPAETASSGESIPIAPVEVRGKRNLFDEQAARRKKLMEESAPCLGCDAKPLVHHPKLLERLADSALNQVTPQAAPEPDAAGSVEHEVMTESRHPTNSNP